MMIVHSIQGTVLLSCLQSHGIFAASDRRLVLPYYTGVMLVICVRLGLLSYAGSIQTGVMQIQNIYNFLLSMTMRKFFMI
jgi:hypothetical protein